MVKTSGACSQSEGLCPRVTLGQHSCFDPGARKLCRLHIQVPANDIVRVADLLLSDVRFQDKGCSMQLAGGYGHTSTATPARFAVTVLSPVRRASSSSL